MEIFLAPLPMGYTFCNLFALQEYVLMLMTSTAETTSFVDHLCFSHAFASVQCCLVVPCWKRADLLALVGFSFSTTYSIIMVNGDRRYLTIRCRCRCDVYCIFVTFQCGIWGQVRYLIVSFPDLCHLSYFLSY